MPRSRDKAKQTRLSFSPTTSHPNDESPNGKTDRLANVRYNQPSAASVVMCPTASYPASATDEISPKCKRPAGSSSSDGPEAPTSSPHVYNDADSDDDDVVIKPRRRLRKAPSPKPTISLDSDSEESDDPIVCSPTKRRKRNIDADAPHTPRRDSDQAKLDLEEDLENLQDSGIALTFCFPRLLY